MRADRLPFFYGWIIVALGMISAAFTIGTTVFAISVFATPMEAELGWSRTTLFGAISARTLLGGMLAPFVGRFYDHPRAPRYMVVVGSILMATTMMSVKWIDSIPVFYAVYGILGSLAMATAGPAINAAIVPKWFVRRRGRALATANMGGPMGTVIFPPLLQFFISTVGWRDAWLYLGLLTLVVLLPLSLLLRTRPEDMGLLPDGEKQAPAGARSTRPAQAEVSLTPREAVRSRTFWLMALGFAFGVFSVQAYQPNWFPFFESRGFNPQLAAVALTVYGLFAMSARQVWGWAADRFEPRKVMAVQALLTGLGVILLLSVNSVPVLFAFTLYQGLTLGGYFLMQQLLLAHYVGRARIGAINGYIHPAMTLGGVLGPLTAGWLFDVTGSYTWTLLPILGTWIACSIFVFATRPIVPRHAPAPATPP